MKQGDATAWAACPSGELQRLSGRTRTRHHRRRFLRVAGALSVLAVGGGTALIAWSNGVFEPTYGGIACSTLRSHAKGFINHELSPELASQIQVHLTQCRRCAEFCKSLHG